MPQAGSWKTHKKAILLVLPGIIWLTIFWIYPLVSAFTLSFREFDPSTLIGTKFTFSNYPRLLSDWFYIKAFGRSLWIAFAATMISLLFGYPAAYHVITMQSRKTKAILILILFVPVMLSLVVTAFAWILILGPNGVINNVFIRTHLFSEPIKLLNSETGVIIVLVYSFIPYMILNIYAALENIDPNLLRAARIHGANAWCAFWKVTFPMSMPGVLSGSLLVFSLSVGAFVTPYIIGGNRVKVIPLLVYNSALSTFNWADAATLSVILLIVMIAITFASTRIIEHVSMSWLTK